MRKAAVVICKAILVITVVHAKNVVAQAPQVATLDVAAIDAAIKMGMERKEPVVFATGEAGGGFTGAMFRAANPSYEIYVQGPLAHIQTLAAENAKKYMPYTVDSIPAAAKYAYLWVRVVPGKPRKGGSGMMQAPPISHIVIQGRGQDPSGAEYQVLQPIRIEKEPVSWGNLMGATFTGEAATAVFDMSKVPATDIDVVVINAGKEFRIRIKKDEIESVR